MKSVCTNTYFESCAGEVLQNNPLLSGDKFRDYAFMKLSERYSGVKKEVTIGTRECGTGHRIDVVIEETKTLVECKIKTGGGSIDDKLMRAVYDLQYALDNFKMKNGKWERGVLLVGGHAWASKNMKWLKEKYVLKFPNISIITYEDDVELKDV